MRQYSQSNIIAQRLAHFSFANRADIIHVVAWSAFDCHDQYVTYTPNWPAYHSFAEVLQVVRRRSYEQPSSSCRRTRLYTHLVTFCDTLVPKTRRILEKKPPCMFHERDLQPSSCAHMYCAPSVSKIALFISLDKPYLIGRKGVRGGETGVQPMS